MSVAFMRNILCGFCDAVTSSVEGFVEDCCMRKLKMPKSKSTTEITSTSGIEVNDAIWHKTRGLGSVYDLNEDTLWVHFREGRVHHSPSLWRFT